MPAQRKPTAVLDALGSTKREPGRHGYRKNEPDTGRGVGPAPDHLTDAEKLIWDEIVSDCAPRVFQSSDRLVLASLCRMEAELRADPAGFGGRKWMVWKGLIAACGMTPADRSRVSVPRNGEEKDKPKVGLASFR